MASTPIDLSRLPAPLVVETLDFETLYSERKAALIALYPADKQAEVAATLALDSEPLAINLQENAYREMLLRQRVNDAARALMLAYAVGADLDHLGSYFGIVRLLLTPPDIPNDIPAVYEADTDLRKRIQLATQGYSVAGPEGAYISHALNADGRVLDASAVSPSPKQVVVTILSRQASGAAPQDLLDTVAAALTDDNVRPLTDLVTVQGAQIVNYAIAATLFTFPGPDAAVVVAEATASANHYAEQARRLGNGITLSAVYAALHVAGVQRVELTSPAANIAINKTQAPFCTGIAVTYGGVYG